MEAPEQRIILTPGPVVTSTTTKQALLRDWSINEPELLARSSEIADYVLDLAGAGDAYACILLQGSGNFANEATLGTLVERDRRLLIVDNGYYGSRLVEIAAGIGLDHVRLDLPLCQPATAEALEAALDADPDIGTMVVCHVDTGTGIHNPLPPLAEVARRRGVGLIIDAVASFGGLPLDARALDAGAIVLTPNKWLEGVPGFGLVLARRDALERAAGRAHSYCLDLHRQWRSFEERGKWRFTPPTQAVAAMAAALRQHAEEGMAARYARIERNWRCLVDGLRALGFHTFLPDEVAAPVIATFHEPADPAYDRERFFQAMWARGFVMFRGSLTPYPTFRIGCMGAIDESVMSQVVAAVGEAMAEMGVANPAPVTPGPAPPAGVLSDVHLRPG